MKGIGKLFGRRASSASLSSSFGQPGLHSNGLPPRKRYPPVDPQKIYNAFINLYHDLSLYTLHIAVYNIIIIYITE